MIIKMAHQPHRWHSDLTTTTTTAQRMHCGPLAIHCPTFSTALFEHVQKNQQMLGHRDPPRMRSDRNDGVTDHTDLRSSGTVTAAIHNSLRSLCRRYTRSQMWEWAFRPILDRIISTEQKGFLSGRSISDCTRVMYDTISECEKSKINGLIHLVDFEKAFDSLSWKYIHESLEKFNFGPNFRKWITLFQCGSNSSVILNGHLSNSFQLHRGCRQGDPISPYLCILCSEFLTLALKMINT